MIARRTALPILFVVLALLTSWGGFVSARMMDANGTMQDCPYMGSSGTCAMSISEHLSGWQNLFASTLDHVQSLDLSLLLVVFLAAYLLIGLPAVPRLAVPLLERWRVRTRFHPLRLAFARGLIHPKIYS